MKPDELITLTMQAKEPGIGDGRPAVDLEVDYEAASVARVPTPTSDCWATPWPADPRLFARQDGVEEAWRIVEPVLDLDGPIEAYRSGAGPANAASVLGAGDDWFDCS